MSELESIGKLRTAARNMAKGRNLENHDECNLLLIIADEIEREVAERFMELPVDADGVPIRVGDLIEFGGKGERLEVTHFGWTKHGDPTIAYRRPNGTLDCSCIGAECRHAKPRTLEDVLDEYYDARGWDECDNCALDAKKLTTKFADEIRAMLGEVER